MKQNFLILILIISLSGCKDKQHTSEIAQSGKFYPEVEQRTVLIGQITNINEFPDAPRVIELSVDDITIDHQHSFETTVNDSGEFIFDIPLYHPINSYLNYGDARITPYLFPNDTMRVKCQIAKKGFKIGIVSGEFDEQHDKFESEFLKQYRWIHYKQINGFRDRLSKDLSPQELKEQYLDFEKAVLEIVENKIRNDSIDTLIADYLRYSAKYSIYKDIIRLGKKIDNETERHKFYSFLTDSIAFNKKAMITSDYKSFLNAFRFYVSSDFENATEIWQEYIMASNLYSNIKRAKEQPSSVIKYYSKRINKELNDKYIRELLLSMCNSIQDKKEVTIDDFSVPSDARLNQYKNLKGIELFNKIVTDNKGKVVYLDVWATWCSPCKQQFPHSQRMHEMLKGKPVSFVYLCCRSDEDVWKRTIAQYQMKGTHILLNDEQYKYLTSKFSIQGIPRYILIDANGSIVNANAPRPDSEEILNEINRLTNEK